MAFFLLINVMIIILTVFAGKRCGLGPLVFRLLDKRHHVSSIHRKEGHLLAYSKTLNYVAKLICLDDM